MGILELIANPQIPSAMEALKAQDMLEARRSRRRMEDIGVRQAEQKMQAQQELAQGKSKGRDIISTLEDIPFEELEGKDLFEVGQKIGSIPGMEKASKEYMDFGLKIKERAQKQSATERKEADELYEKVAGPFAEVGKLTDAGKIPEAKQLYEKTMGFVLNDERVKDNKQASEFFSAIREYKPGLAKFVYTSTRSAKNARDETTAHQKVLEGQAQRRADIAEKGLAIRERTQADKQYNQRIKTTTGLRKEYSSQTSEITDALDQITLGKEALNQGKPISDKMAQAVLSKVANSKVRALAELEQYKNFGDLQERISGFFSRVVTGKYTDTQRDMALDALDNIETMYKEMQGEAKDYFHYLAEEGKLDSHSIAKYDSATEVVENPYLSDEQKMEVLKRAFPQEFPD